MFRDKPKKLSTFRLLFFARFLAVCEIHSVWAAFAGNFE